MYKNKKNSKAYGLICEYCNTYYPNKRALTIHEYFHTSEDINTLLSFSEVSDQSYNLPTARNSNSEGNYGIRISEMYSTRWNRNNRESAPQALKACQIADDMDEMLYLTQKYPIKGSSFKLLKNRYSPYHNRFRKNFIQQHSEFDYDKQFMDSNRTFKSATEYLDKSNTTNQSIAKMEDKNIDSPSESSESGYESSPKTIGHVHKFKGNTCDSEVTAVTEHMIEELEDSRSADEYSVDVLKLCEKETMPSEFDLLKMYDFPAQKNSGCSGKQNVRINQSIKEDHSSCNSAKRLYCNDQNFIAKNYPMQTCA